jgi:uncharacterized protein
MSALGGAEPGQSLRARAPGINARAEERTLKMLKDDLNAQIKDAMKTGQKERLGTLRLMMSTVKDFEINNKHIAATDADILTIYRKMVKQRRDTIETFRQGGREDMVVKEEAEIAIIESFLPPPVTEAEIIAAVDAVIAETGAKSVKEMGRVMKGALEKLAGRADGAAVNKFVKERLTAQTAAGV